MKCLPNSKISQAQGVVLHDWHAEILTIRSFNRFLLEECHALALSQKSSSDFIRIRHQDERTESHFQPFALNDGVKLHMYCSEAPCKSKSLLQKYIKTHDFRWRRKHGTYNGRSRRLYALGPTPSSLSRSTFNHDFAISI
jgi:hypothetical protein